MSTRRTLLANESTAPGELALLCEHAVEPITVVDDPYIVENAVEIKKKDNGGPMVIRGVFQRCDVKNANGRVYSRGLWESQLAEHSALMRSVKNRTCCGHIEHPPDGVTALDKAAIIVRSLKLESDGTVIGEAEVLDTPLGAIVRGLIRSGVAVGVSSRGTGAVNGDGHVDECTFSCKTWDIVSSPSTPGAFPRLVESQTLLPLIAAMTNAVQSSVPATPVTETAQTNNRLSEKTKMSTSVQQLVDRAKAFEQKFSSLASTTRSVSESLHEATSLREEGLALLAEMPAVASDDVLARSALAPYAKTISESVQLIDEACKDDDEDEGDDEEDSDDDDSDDDEEDEDMDESGDAVRKSKRAIAEAKEIVRKNCEALRTCEDVIAQLRETVEQQNESIKALTETAETLALDNATLEVELHETLIAHANVRDAVIEQHSIDITSDTVAEGTTEPKSDRQIDESAKADEADTQPRTGTIAESLSRTTALMRGARIVVGNNADVKPSATAVTVDESAKANTATSNPLVESAMKMVKQVSGGPLTESEK